MSLPKESHQKKAESGTLVIETTADQLANHVKAIEMDPTFISAYVSPHLDIDTIGQILSACFPQTPKSICSTAIDLYAINGLTYCEKGPSWNKVIVHCFDATIIQQAEVFALPLECEDLRQGKVRIDLDERVGRLKKHIEDLTVEMDIDYRDTLVYTLFDGLSCSESFFLEALYDSGCFPCLFAGGSAGGKRDFSSTWLHDGQQKYENHVLLSFLKMAPGVRFGIMKTHSFVCEDTSFSILAASLEQRYITQVIDSKKQIVNFIDALCETFDCPPDDLEKKLTDYSFAIRVGGKLFIRSVAKIDIARSIVHFYCDIAPGEQLFLVKKTSLSQSTQHDFEHFLQNKPSPPIAGILSDCVLRRLFNGSVQKMEHLFDKAAISGYSTFGETLGLHLNQTLTGIFFFRVPEGATFNDEYIDNFTVNYSEFKAFFLKRKLAKLEGLSRIVIKQIDAFKKHQYTKRFNVTGMDVTMASVFDGLNDLGHVLNEAEDQRLMMTSQIEEELRESEERFRLLSESSLTGVYLIQNNRLSYVNTAFAQMFGYEVEEVIDILPLQTLAAPEDRDLIIENIQRRISGETQSLRYTFRGQRKNGSRFYLEVHGKRIMYKGETGVIGSCIDITEQKQAQAALQISEAKYRALYNETPSMFFTISSLGIITAVNDFAAEHLGYSKDTLLGEYFFNIFLSKDREQVRKHFATCFREPGRIVTWQYQKRCWDRSLMWCEDVARSVSDEHGNENILIVSQDITQRKQLEESLKVSQFIFDQASIAIFLIENDMFIIDANSYACQSLGYSKEELCKLSINDIDPELTEDGMNNLLHSLESSQSATIQTSHKRKNGEIFPVQVFISTLPYEGTPLRVSFAKDISDMEKARLEQERLKTQLEQVQRLEAIGRLAGGIAHDLNNLLTPILGYAGLLASEKSIPDKAKDRLAHINKAAVGARDLIKQLLAFSRKQVLEYKKLDLSQLVNEFSTLLRRTIRENIDITITSSPDLKPIIADQGQIEQILMNLVVNAADAMPEGGKLAIETSLTELDETYTAMHPETNQGKYAMLSVSDTGIGMDEKTVEKIFEPFFSTKGDLGTGLGLATVYGIVKQHQGTVWVYSEPGLGSTFKVFLPISDHTEQVASAEQAVTDVVQGTESIFLVEDNNAVRSTVCDILKENGYQVTSAANGQAAAKMFAQHLPVDLLLTDVIMPDMNGKELYTLLSAQAPGLKVLYMSGYMDDIIAHHGVLEEGVQFIQKPFNSRAILQKIRTVLDL